MTYLSVYRALKLRRRISDFYTLNYADLADDTLLNEEWEQLKEMENILRPFQQVIKALKGNLKYAHHGLI